MSVHPNFVSIISVPNAWIDFKFSVRLYIDGVYIVSHFGYCTLSASSFMGLCHFSLNRMIEKILSQKSQNPIDGLIVNLVYRCK